MIVEYKRVEDNMVQYECMDHDGKMYGVADTVYDGMIVKTLVIDMQTYDEVEDSELFKRIVTARSAVMNSCDDILETILEL
jgi:hypothetical protein